MQELSLFDSATISGSELYTAAGVRELDRQAIEVQSVPGYTLMQRAGKFMFQQLELRFEQLKPVDSKWLVLCGAGNNAGDGYVIARLAAAAGYQVVVVALQQPGILTGDALLAADDWLENGSVISWQDFQSSLDTAEFDLCIDALLGTGLDRSLSGVYLDVVEWLNQQAAVVAAVDIPTGLNADTGAVGSAAVTAGLTCTFIGRKQGLYTAAGRECCGEVVFNDLDVPSEIYPEVVNGAELLGSLPERIAARSANSHKGSYGHVLLCGGQAGMSGAVMLAGEAGLRAGAGMVTIATAAEHAASLNIARPELMVRVTEDKASLEVIARKADVLAVGPGLGTDDWGRHCFEVLVKADADGVYRPLVVDADGLNLLAKQPFARGNWVLTPHPAEAARLLGVSTADIQADRFAAVRQLAEQYQAVVVLKGSGTLIASHARLSGAADLLVDVCPFGNPGMATAGMGDVLTGLIAALLAQGMTLLQAARLGVVIHARAGDYLAAMEGQVGLLAGDMPAAIRHLLNNP
ncbi:MAG: NAD(P)H-hydrate dehydratase [Proteobacteria bacterium]|nr:NAD(P)H-hydrate dehydratase [Pseudomonadota bacterium]